jgi:L-threonylcarbamoyladenylate synthase
MKNKFLSWGNLQHIEKVAEILQKGGAILGSSDTVLGLLANVSKEGIELLNHIKERADKPYIVLIGKKERIFDFTEVVSPEVQALMDACWPGPLTLIVKTHGLVSSCITQGKGTVAIRMPQHTGILMLLRRIPALFSTSANKSGEPVAYSIDEVDPHIIENTQAIIVDDSAGRVRIDTKPSTIIDCTGSELKIVREGAYPIQSIEKIIGKKIARS